MLALVFICIFTVTSFSETHDCGSVNDERKCTQNEECVWYENECIDLICDEFDSDACLNAQSYNKCALVDGVVCISETPHSDNGNENNDNENNENNDSQNGGGKDKAKGSEMNNGGNDSKKDNQSQQSKDSSESNGNFNDILEYSTTGAAVESTYNFETSQIDSSFESTEIQGGSVSNNIDNSLKNPQSTNTFGMLIPVCVAIGLLICAVCCFYFCCKRILRKKEKEQMENNKNNTKNQKMNGVRPINTTGTSSNQV